MMWPGGATGMSSNGGPSKWAASGKYLVGLLMNANDNDDFFPLWGTCLGYELIAEIFANNYTFRIRVSTGSDTIKDLYLTASGNSS